MDKKQQASSSSQGDPRFKVGSGGYDSAAWMAANRGTGGGGPVLHNDPSKFDKCHSYPYTRMSDAKADSAQSSSKKK
ncbi:hypothetical protein L2227_05825 [Wolbachia endosymbiont of Delia radicum]|uniref:hypothetical protein n=1 Tax=Wolbachia endosymbiont of Delia radicum TaxID=502352 RepID=UPI001F3B4E28|nr:hypothetical protein [Wolbachia endosymbiont of Delia radicum]UJQ20679.1 hypothetical protein L2227_05825 [Wolbachia endosymbiont of Delia radicum]